MSAPPLDAEELSTASRQAPNTLGMRVNAALNTMLTYALTALLARLDHHGWLLGTGGGRAQATLS